MRKKAVILIMLAVLGLGNIGATGMPVIDVSSIAATVQGIVAEASRWKQQISQWQSEYDRIKKMAEGLATGDWQKVLLGISEAFDIAGDMTLQFGDLQDEKYANALRNWSGTASDIVKIHRTGSAMTKNIQLIASSIQQSFEKKMKNADGTWASDWGMNNAYQSNASLGNAWSYGDAVAEGAIQTINLGSTILTNLLSLATTSADAWNNLMDSVYLDGDEYLKLLEGMKQDIYQSLDYSTESAFLEAAIGSNGDLAAKNREYSQAQKELATINQTEEPQRYAEQQTKVDTLYREMENISSAYANYKVIDDIIADVENRVNAASFKANSVALETAAEAHDKAVRDLSMQNAFATEAERRATEKTILRTSLGYGMTGAERSMRQSVLRISEMNEEIAKIYGENPVVTVKTAYGTTI